MTVFASGGSGAADTLTDAALAAAAGRNAALAATDAAADTVADGASIFSMMTLAAGQGAELVLQAQGEQAADVLTALQTLVAGGFGEK